MTRLVKFLNLPSSDQRLLMRCVALLALIRVGLNMLTLARMQQLLQHGRDKVIYGKATAQHNIERLLWAVRTAAGVVPGATCLTQALAAEHLLARAGWAARLRLGVARGPDGEFLAHAWVEQDGRVVLGDDGMLPAYTALPALK